MPIHIREIVVKASVGNEIAAKPKLFGKAKRLKNIDRESIIAECMDNVMRMLKEHKDR